MMSFKESSKASKLTYQNEESIKFIHGYLALELDNIRKQRLREITKIENERKTLADLGMTAPVKENQQNQVHNTKTNELYKELSKKENVYSVLKHGDKPYFDHFGQPLDKHHPENDILVREQIITRHQ